MTCLIQKKIDGSEKNRIIFCGIAVVTIMLALLFVSMKEYPIDLDASGNALYDPLRSISSFASKAGLAIGFLAAWILEEKYIAFSTENLTFGRRIIRALTAILLYFLMAIIAAGVSSIIPIAWVAAFMQNAIMYFGVIFFAPLIFTKIESHSRS